MALLDIFKRKEKPAAAKKQAAPKAERVRKAEPRKVDVAVPKSKKISGQAYRILKRPHVTEKATDLTANNQYVFEIFPDSNKNQVKKAVEDVYGIDVVSVKIINIHRKRRRLGRIEGWGHGCKKAVVKIKEGQKIEVLPR